MKNTKKIILGVGALGALVAPVAATVSCSLFGQKEGKSSYQFWNYEDYMSNEDGANYIDQIKSVFDYTEFGDLPEFRQALVDGGAAGGIGSDYFNAKLAEDGLISKIDFGRLYGISNDKATWEKTLSTYYTPEAWKLLNSFKLYKHDKDGNLINKDGAIVAAEADASNDIDGDGSEDFLWEYMAPYFIQNKVVAVNLDRLDQTKLAKAATDAGITNTGDDITNDELNTIIKHLLGSKPMTYSNIFAVLQNDLGVSKFMVNDYMRDNMMIGSENQDGTAFTGGLSGADDKAKLADAKSQISNFMSIVKSNFNNVKWATSGVETLESLISPEKDRQAALMYNGDALYAYNGGEDPDDNPDNDNPKAGHVRAIVPLNPTFLLDGFVIASEIADKPIELDRIYGVGRNIIYKGVNTSANHADGSDGSDGSDFEGYASDNNIFSNFDYVGYTAAFNELYKYLDKAKTYFTNDDGSADVTGHQIFSATRVGANVVDATGHPVAEANHVLNKNHITQPISDNLTIQIQNFYEGQK